MIIVYFLSLCLLALMLSSIFIVIVVEVVAVSTTTTTTTNKQPCVLELLGRTVMGMLFYELPALCVATFLIGFGL